MDTHGLGFSLGINSELASVKNFLKDNDELIILDIGANYGNYTKRFLVDFPNTKYHLFEPQKICYDYLKSQFKNNSNIKVFNFAVSDKDTNSYIYFDKIGSPKASLYKRDISHHKIKLNYKEKIKVINFNNFFENNYTKVSLLKIDIEGNEYSLLNSIRNKFRFIDIIQFEFGGCNVDSKVFFRDLFYLLNNEFSIHRISPSGPILVLAYDELFEVFRTSNYLAVNKNL